MADARVDHLLTKPTCYIQSYCARFSLYCDIFFRQYVTRVLCCENVSTLQRHDLTLFPTVHDLKNQIHQAIKDIENGTLPLTASTVRPEFFYFLFYRFFLQQVRVGGRNKIKNKIHSDHFPIELKSKETHVSFDFNSIGKWSE